MPQYHTILMRDENDVFSPQFGAYEKSVAVAEIPELMKSFNLPRSRFKLLTTPNDLTFTIEAHIKTLNRGLPLRDSLMRLAINREQIQGAYEQVQRGLISVTEFCNHMTAMDYSVVKLVPLSLFDEQTGLHCDDIHKIFPQFM